jgi:UDP-N-acetylmuramoyl-tripeptide--D-alanyl-D-alanine ligase
VVTGVNTDTRTLAPGQLFIALKGPRFDGHDFAAQALQMGAAAAVVSLSYEPSAGLKGILLKVKDPLTALGDLAAAWRDEHSLRVLAVTGSSGKTTSKDMLASILSVRYRVLKSDGNFNNLIGLPLTLLRLRPEHSAAVLEMGMSWPGEIARLTQISQPDVGLITNVGPAHLQNMGSLSNIAKAKTELWQNMKDGAAIVNLDDPRLAPWARKFKGQAITFGTGGMVSAAAAEPYAFGQRFWLHLGGVKPAAVKLAALGSHNVQNALGAAAAALALGLSGEEIADGLNAFTPGSGRLRLLTSAGGVRILDDAYNANPDSVAASLKTLAQLVLAHDVPLRPVAVLGDMLELGAASKSLHQQAGAAAAENGIELLLALGAHAPHLVRGAKNAGLDNACAFASHEQLEAALAEKIAPADMVLVKGSHGMNMERTVKFLLRAYAPDKGS